MYSFKKGFWKAVKTASSIALAFVTFAGFSDVNLWLLLQQYLEPILSSMTVAGILTMVINYAKVKVQA